MFSLSIPTKVYFGRNCLSDAIKAEKDRFSGKKVLIVTTGRSLHRQGYIRHLEELLIGCTDCVTVFDGISPNPKLSEIKEGTLSGKENEVDIVVGFGGGSSIDAAKAIAAGVGCDETLDDMFYGGIEPSDKTLPIIAIPTTAGTGSELSKGAIISDGNRKSGIRGNNIFPKAAIVDPFLTDTIPLKTTLETGFDVFAHAIESYISKKANRFSEDLSLTVIDIVSRALSKLTVDTGDKAARDDMSYASMLMGVNLGNVGTALPHRMQYPVGALTDTSHAAGLLSLYPAWIKMEWEVSTEKMKKAADILYKNDQSLGKEKDALLGFVDLIGRRSLDQLFSDAGYKGEHDGLMLSEMVGGSLENDPAYKGKDTLTDIYDSSR